MSGLDLDVDRIAMLLRGECPIFEPGLTELMNRNADAGRLHFTADRDDAYRNADVIFICVGTPTAADGWTASNWFSEKRSWGLERRQSPRLPKVDSRLGSKI